jgi:hypothetical protein
VSPFVAQHLEGALADLEDRDVERAAAEVVDGDDLVALLVEAVGERRRRRLVDDAQHFEAGDLAGVLRGLALASLKYAGTVMTASVTGSPRYASASAFSFCRIIALISGGRVLARSPIFTLASPFDDAETLYGTSFRSRCTSGSSSLRPMNRLMLKTVFSGFVTACRLATWPTSRSPLFVTATMLGVVRAPSAFGMTTGSPPSITAMQLLVVPRSIPITLPIRRYSSFGAVLVVVSR